VETIWVKSVSTAALIIGETCERFAMSTLPIGRIVNIKEKHAVHQGRQGAIA
jgi:hypothetical protein